MREPHQLHLLICRHHPMTHQIHDVVHYQGDSYILGELAGGTLFSPQDFGLFPVASSTACWRGFRAEYNVLCGCLCLHSLNINHQSVDRDVEFESYEEMQGFTQRQRHADIPPLINGKAAEYQQNGLVGSWHYHNLDLHLNFTGSIEMVDGSIRSSAHYGGYPQTGLFDKVIRASFRTGYLESVQDITAELASKRRNKW